MSTPVLKKITGPLNGGVASTDSGKKPLHFDGAWVIYSFVVLMIVVLLWASLFKIDEITRGEGKIIPSSEVKIVQHLEGGVITTVKVKIGDSVKAGDSLLVLDPRRQNSSLQDARSELRNITIEILRNEALLNGTALNIPENLSREVDLAAHRSAYENEKARYLSEMRGIDSEIGRLQSEAVGIKSNLALARGDVDLAQKNLTMVKRLEGNGSVSEYERIREERESINSTKEMQRLEARSNEIAKQIQQSQARKSAVSQQYQSERWARLSELYAKKNALLARENVAEDGVDRTIVKSPVAGIVKNVFVNAVGAVVQAGSPLVEIVPIEDDLLVEARIKPQDIGFVTLGQMARIKVTAYDFAIYGALTGVVEHISADSITTKDREFYVVRVRIKDGYRRGPLALKSGMTISVDIIAGEKTVLRYLAKPIVRGLSEAMSER